MISASSFLPVDSQTHCRLCLACPICGDTYVHPVGLVCHSPGTANGLVRISRQGVALDPTVPPVGHGVAVRLRFSCESGHWFEYELQFSKGNTFLARSMGDHGDNRPDWMQTIWRD